MLFSVEQAFVGREEIRAPLKTPAWEAIYYPVLLCIAKCGHVVTMYVLSWIKVSELKSLFFCLLHSLGVAQEKALFRNENIVFLGGQRSFRIVNGY